MKNLVKNIVMLIIILVFLTGCASIRAFYDIGLIEVERPAKTKERYGEQKISKVEENGIEKYYFEDEMVKILWIPTSADISFVLTNKTDHTIKIMWDEAAYVDIDGVSHRIMHSGVKFIDRDNPQTPTIVVRKGFVSDLIFPADYVYYVSGQYGGWRQSPLFPNFRMGGDAEKQELKGIAEKYIGKSVQVLLPLQIEEIVNEYIFTFKINSVQVKFATKNSKSTSTN